MTKNIIIVISLITTFYLHSLFAEINYQLIAYEHEQYRSYSLAELSALLAQDASLLSYYRCNGKNEKNIFYPAARKNEKRNSLRIQLHDSPGVAIYREGNFYNEQGKNETSKFLSDLYVRHVYNAMMKLETIPSMQRILRALESSHYPLKITLGGNSFAAHAADRAYGGIYRASAILILSRLRKADDPLPFNHIGNGGDINWYPNAEVMALEDDNQLRVAPPAVTLAHELYHAFDAIRGYLDQRHVRAADTMMELDQHTQLLPTNYWTGQSSLHDSATVSEYRAVYFENLIRKFLGLRLRKSYTGAEVEVKMLDHKKRPLLIPAPCLQ